MNTIGKIGAIIFILLSSLILVASIFIVVFGWMFSELFGQVFAGFESHKVGFVILFIGITFLVTSFLSVYYSVKYMNDGRYKVFVGVIAILATIIFISIPFLSLLYLVSSILIFLGKKVK